ncbi:MAG TPA: response regulator transcription factor [Ktedonobacterales bacterium]
MRPSSDAPAPQDIDEEADAGSQAQRRRASGARVLVIDDEPEIGRAVRLGLRSADFTVESCATGAAGLERVAQWRPDVILLDLSLPDMDGVEVCRRLRAWTQTPIIVLSVRSREADKVAALEQGADDYLTKPFGMSELIARVRVALRHAAQTAGPGGAAGALVRVGELELDLERRLVTVGGQPVHLTPTEYEVLKYMATHMGKVITHQMLLHAVWGPSYEAEAHYLRVFINQLRRKIEPDPSRPRYLITEPGIGYRLREAE